MPTQHDVKSVSSRVKYLYVFGVVVINYAILIIIIIIAHPGVFKAKYVHEMKRLLLWPLRDLRIKQKHSVWY